MEILITGGAGYIGSNLVKKLLDVNFKVRVLDNLVFGGEPLVPFFNDSNFTLIKGDLTNHKDIEKAVKGCDLVIHLGALVFTGGEDLSTEVDTVNYTATKLLVMECIKNKIKHFLFFSTCSVYGKTNEKVDELSPVKPTNPYAFSKYMSEQFLLSPEIKSKITPIIFRLSTVFGLSPRMRFDLIINELCANAYKNKKIEVYNPEAWRPGVHVDDVTDLVTKSCFLLSECNFERNNIFNVGYDTLNYQKKELCDIIKRELPDVEIITKNTGDVRDYKVSFDKVKETFLFYPMYSVEDGVKEIIDALKKGVYKHPYDISHNNLKTYQQYYHDKWRNEK